ncbi:hypothetical protein [Frankia sp. Cppng1_Ct_nod]|uniref:hypothetical protein n=1 Tax=Frankia sp. Cppng1_Ct_nod TaxID=2897162 RepID=UPI001040E5E7|nr:hypothetical protein [Frankia sp. Cppng1_Ct_nod]
MDSCGPGGSPGIRVAALGCSPSESETLFLTGGPVGQRAPRNTARPGPGTTHIQHISARLTQARLTQAQLARVVEP